MSPDIISGGGKYACGSCANISVALLPFTPAVDLDKIEGFGKPFNLLGSPPERLFPDFGLQAGFSGKGRTFSLETHILSFP